ncbi:MAG TPA: bifunctional DNA-binding transcriptional regulator/O6-methylguanine-DNA methyltransferase Ada [Aggregatilineales bacterium]|nr:bifunctional DNA-binding transcriptional regulator/O6-methylguanine-DNA methyltransferase Ada [Anaerolineales bacterium]HRE47948.1 bifunctional DNA-binding transcriptional regulator/O6-methylguanine-DNA methyltransferase Ada [Aggregatilineales bacterium]
MIHYTTDAERWAAITTRDANAEGVFWYGVATTGVYCRPTCTSRQPRPENVSYFDSPAAAEAEGFRPCKRCSPQTAAANPQQQAAILTACAILSEAESRPTLETLATAVGMSPFHLHRTFKRIVGVTPFAYHKAQRLKRLHVHLRREATVTAALHNAGYTSTSRFYEQDADLLGMTPSAYGRGGKGMNIHYGTAESALGWVVVGATERGICAVEFTADPADAETLLQARFPKAALRRAESSFEATVQQVVALMATPSAGTMLPLDVQGTAFQHKVWTALRAIPAGTTLSYGDLAARIGLPKASRAVGRAVATNPLAVIIPCHRIVGKAGKLTGYRWGVARKKRLLEAEKA